MTRRWDVYLPSGDLASTTVFHGLTAPRKPLDQIPISTRADAYTMSNAKAKSMTPGYTVTAEREQQGDGEITWILKFRPQLGSEPVTILLERYSTGLVFTSEEAQRRFGVADDKTGIENCTHFVRYAMDQLVMCLRFRPDEPAEIGEQHFDSVPRNVQLEITDQHKRLSQEELDSDAVCMANFGIADATAEGEQIGELPQSVVTVHRPQLGYRYRFVWALPETDLPIDQKALLSHYYRLVCESPEGGQDDYMQNAVDQVRSTVRERMGEIVAGANWADGNLHVFLFGYNEEHSRLECLRSTAGSRHPLVQARFPWGRTVVGVAFRQRRATDFCRPYFQRGNAIFGDFPNEVVAALAIPLGGAPEPVSDWPIAVVLLASTTADSGLLQAHENDVVFETLCEFAEDSWFADVPERLREAASK